MTERTEIRLKWWYLLPALLVLVLVTGIFASAVSAAAGRLIGMSGGQVSQVGSSPLTGSGSASSPGNLSPRTNRNSPNAIDGFIVMVPDTVTLGSCPAPANGGTTQVGCRFVLDLFVNAGTNMAPDGLTAQQSYMTFTYQTIQNARVTGIATSCVPTGTITADISVFDAPLQNEVCDGPAQCNFRGTIVDPGSFAFASGALQNCASGCPDPGGGPPFDQNPFRVAQVGVCAVAPGQAGFFWQFSNVAPNDRCQNGAPQTRDTELVTVNSELVQDCTRFANYTFTVTGPTSTPSVTSTQGAVTNTPTRTVTVTPSITLPPSTFTPTRTNTAVANTLTPTRTNTAVANTLTPTRTNTAAANTNTPTRTVTATSTTVGSTVTPTRTSTALAGNGFIFLTPDTTTLGNCPAPPNGGTTQVGCRFVLDLFVNAGTNMAPDGLTAQQSYMTFTYQIIQNARVTGIATSCVPTNTVTADTTVFDAPLQNEVCNGPNPCNFRGSIVDPGSLAYASGALQNCPMGCPDPGGGPPFDQNPFRVAQIGICAVAPGQATLYWQFANTPPNDRCLNGAPSTRDTELVTFNGELVQDCTLFTNYTFTVTGGATNTPIPTSVTTSTRTITPTPSATGSAVPPTRTNTTTRTSTIVPPTLTTTATSSSTIVPATRTSTTTSTSTIVPATRTSTTTSTSTIAPPTLTTTATSSSTIVPPTRTSTTTSTSTVVAATRTSTTISTSTRTNTAVPPTITRTRTPAVTGTPCDRCQADIRDVTLTCNPDGTLEWSAIVKNNGQCTLTVGYRVTLQARLHGHGGGGDEHGWINVSTQRGFVTVPPRGEVVVFGNFCYQFPDDVDKLRVEFALDGSSHECMKKKKSHQINTCNNTPTCPPLFPDVPVSNPYYSVVLGLASNGVVSGYADGTFRPDASVNRGQVAKMIVLAYELNTDGQSNGSQSTQGIEHFSDVPANSPYYTYIERAYSLGVVSGYSDGTFQPYSEVSRAQLAKMVVKALSLPLSNPAQPSFSDVGAGSTFYNYIETVKANGLLAGYDDGTFKPGETMTRGEVAEVLDQAR